VVVSWIELSVLYWWTDVRTCAGHRLSGTSGWPGLVGMCTVERSLAPAL
jgi:hypothetical protein